MAANNPQHVAAQILDSPNTTSSTTYKLQCGTRRVAGTGTGVIGGSFNTSEVFNPNSASSITLMEIGA